MTDPLSLLISGAALAVSVTTAWLTLLRRGELKMTRPAVVYFGADGPIRVGETPKRKVYLRTLMYSTGKRGCVIEAMFITLRRGETRQTFNVWVYGEEKLTRGSGLFVGETGLTCNHHFLLPSDGTEFQFLEGAYQLEVFATVVGNTTPTKLCSMSLNVTDTIARQLQIPENGAYFDWGPDSQHYAVHIKAAPYTVAIPEAVIPRG